MPNISAPMTRKCSSGSRAKEPKKDALAVREVSGACGCSGVLSRPDAETSPPASEIVDIKLLRTTARTHEGCLCNGLIGVSRVSRADESQNRSAAIFRRRGPSFKKASRWRHETQFLYGVTECWRRNGAASRCISLAHF